MKVGVKHFVIFLILVYSGFLCLFYLNDIDIGGFIGLFILFVVSFLLTFVVFQGILMMLRTQLSFWISPVLKLAAQIILLDGEINEKEIKKVRKFLSRELGEGMAINSYNFFKRQLKNNEIEFDEVISYLANNSAGSEKIKIMQFLVGIVLSDRFLSNEEEKLIRTINRKIGLSIYTLEMIYSLYNFVSENEKKKINKSSNYSLSKAYKLLELDSSATLDDVKDSYRRLAKIFHPDVRNKLETNEERAKQQFQAITDAYDLLKKKQA